VNYVLNHMLFESFS